MKNIRKLLLIPTVTMLISFTMPVTLLSAQTDCTNPANAAACNPQNAESPCSNPATANSPLCTAINNTTNPVTGNDGVLTAATRLVSWLVGIASILGIIVGSIRFTIASGDANSISAAKKTILYSMIGVVVAVFAQAMVILVL